MDWLSVISDGSAILHNICFSFLAFLLTNGDESVMMNCFYGMIDQWKALSLISSRYQCQSLSPSQVYNMPLAGIELVQDLSLGFTK